MARDRTRYAYDKGVPAAPPVGMLSGLAPSRPDPPTTTQLRILACLQTVAILLESNDAYLPIFLRLERELEAEAAKQEIIARARTYLPNQV